MPRPPPSTPQAVRKRGLPRGYVAPAGRSPERRANSGRSLCHWIPRQLICEVPSVAGASAPASRPSSSRTAAPSGSHLDPALARGTQSRSGDPAGWLRRDSSPDGTLRRREVPYPAERHGGSPRGTDSPNEESTCPYAQAQDGVRLYYEETGSGTPILFVHEFAGDHLSWEPQLRYFRARLPGDHLRRPWLPAVRRARGGLELQSGARR